VIFKKKHFKNTESREALGACLLMENILNKLRQDNRFEELVGFKQELQKRIDNDLSFLEKAEELLLKHRS
jgi:hypothetical protein